MKIIKITEKESDAILCMIEFFIVGFHTRWHKRIKTNELIDLEYKIRKPNKE